MLGLLWTIIQPLIALAIFSFFFGYLLKMEGMNMPYPLYALIGMLSWILFSQIMTGAGTSLIESQHLMNRLYFPRLILLLSKSMVAFTEFGFSMALVIVVLLVMGRIPGWPILLAPFFILFNIVTGLAVAIWLSALTVRYRDIHHLIPFLVNFGIWFTPVFYPSSLIPANYQFLLYINPLAAVMAGLRWSIAGGSVPEMAYLFSIIPVALLLISGLFYFRKIENSIADFI